MRKRRVVIFHNDKMILSMMKYFFSIREGYDVLLYETPIICPIWDQERSCSSHRPCADIIFADLDLPGMNGYELFKAQTRRGCRVPIRNKALLSASFDMIKPRDIVELGCAFFEKPLDFHSIGEWLAKREQYINLSQRLGIKRLENRIPCKQEVLCSLSPGHDGMKGLAVNMSPSGLCLTIRARLDGEKKVFIHQKSPDPSRAASVRWAKEIGRGLFRTGLQYVADIEALR